MCLSLSTLLLFALVLIVIGYCISLISGLSDWNQNYYRLRLRYVGEHGVGGVIYGLYFATPTLMFQHGPIHCKLKSSRKFYLFGPRQTELRMSWQGEPMAFTLTASPKSAVHKYKPIRIDSQRAFEQVYNLTGHQPRLEQKFLSAGIHSELERLRTLNQDGTLQVTLDGRFFRVTKPGYLRDLPTLDEFIRRSINLHQQLAICQDQGILFLDHDQRVVMERIQCPLCKAPIDGPMVVCSRCQTPHCKDCWIYNHKCSAYACNETRYDEVQSADPAGNRSFRNPENFRA